LAITKQKKQESVAQLKDMLARSQAVFLSDYRGLTASQMATVRGRMRPFDSKFLVAKNTLVSRSLQEVGMPVPEDLLEGPTAIGFCFGDFREPARILRDIARETSILIIKGGLLGNSVLDPQAVLSLPELPSTETLRAQALGALQAPMSGFVGVLDSALRGLLYVFQARAEQMGNA
jgi:large subunit ribosomal protein L10